ncbi:hypothetical protein C8R45DRAFT_942423 [Mycena sanguinolenta]|nr:hypothetical protein C8R45DRAFT_942423 [Mycena sanguinolenta]
MGKAREEQVQHEFENERLVEIWYIGGAWNCEGTYIFVELRPYTSYLRPPTSSFLSHSRLRKDGHLAQLVARSLRGNDPSLPCATRVTRNREWRIAISPKGYRSPAVVPPPAPRREWGGRALWTPSVPERSEARGAVALPSRLALIVTASGPARPPIILILAHRSPVDSSFRADINVPPAVPLVVKLAAVVVAPPPALPFSAVGGCATPSLPN